MFILDRISFQKYCCSYEIACVSLCRQLANASLITEVLNFVSVPAGQILQQESTTLSEPSHQQWGDAVVMATDEHGQHL